MNRCGTWNGIRALAGVALVVLVAGVAGCSTATGGFPSMPDVSAIDTPEEAKTALSSAQKIRALFRDNIAHGYSAGMIKPDRYRQLRSLDNAFTEQWARLASYVDIWAADRAVMATSQPSSDVSALARFRAEYPQLKGTTDLMKQEVRR